ncbi:RusA family crossover junction endodeoxyribonuclease [Bifidobacterium tissieri]|nr:RusA family crossover junction endodeoxyribonuclease [Bifidobacterium tissieri]
MTFHDVMAFTVPGSPQVKQRPRVYRNGGVHGVTPKATLQAEQRIRNVFRQCWPDADTIQGDVALYCEFWLPDRQRRDLDNLEKLVMDALNGIAYQDDQQIIRKTSAKHLPDPMVPRANGRGMRKRRSSDPLTYEGTPKDPCTRIIIYAKEGR